MTEGIKRLSLAVALGMGAVSPAVHAVNLAGDGLGEYVIVPYYTVRAGFDTYLNVTNTSARTIIIKVRFREAYNSRNVRDFNVILSPYDVWTAAVTSTADDRGARINVYDRSCTIPSNIAATESSPLGGVEFTSELLTDGGPDGSDRTKEGFVEIINMGTALDENQPIAVNSLHIQSGDANSGTPADCAANDAYFTAENAATQQFGEPVNVLKVNTSFINVLDGTGFGVDSVTLANFYNPDEASTYIDGAASTVSGSGLVFPPHPLSSQPDANSVFPRVSRIHTDSAELGLLSRWSQRPELPDPVSAVFMATAVYNQFRVDGDFTDTDWVVNFPTKYFYTDHAEPVDAPFPEVFAARSPATDSGACHAIDAGITDREELGRAEPVYIGPPEPQPASYREFCHAVSVLTFGNGVLGAASAFDIGNRFYTYIRNGQYSTTSVGYKDYDAGWVSLELYPVNEYPYFINQHYPMMQDDAGVIYKGLPAIGFAVTALDNGVASNNALRYAFGWQHACRRTICSTDDMMNPTGFPAVEPGFELACS
jgi:hypothetical protein